MKTVFWLAATSLVIKLIMLLLVLEGETLIAVQTDGAEELDAEVPQANEEALLLPSRPDGKYKIQGEVGSIIKHSLFCIAFPNPGL
ncbi:hypothetical protein IL306_011851, partial [Fusarium sp. DS 682]